MPQNLDADQILKRARPVTDQHAREIQPFGHLVRMPIALSVAMAHDVAETTLIPRGPKGREEVPSFVSTSCRHGSSANTSSTCLR